MATVGIKRLRLQQHWINHLDAVDRSLEVIFVVQQDAVNDQHKLLSRTHSDQPINIVRNRVEYQRYKLGLP